MDNNKEASMGDILAAALARNPRRDESAVLAKPKPDPQIEGILVHPIVAANIKQLEDRVAYLEGANRQLSQMIEEWHEKEFDYRRSIDNLHKQRMSFMKLLIAIDAVNTDQEIGDLVNSAFDLKVE